MLLCLFNSNNYFMLCYAIIFKKLYACKMEPLYCGVVDLFGMH